MSTENTSPKFNDFKKAIDNLKEVLNLPETNDITRDSAIKRFELCFDLSWKLIKWQAQQQGAEECYSPRACFKTAWQIKLIDYDEQWLEMIKDRNLTSHLYKKEMAERVHSHLKNYLELFEKLTAALEKSR